MLKFVAKTYGYVVREVNGGSQVLVFRHRDFPEAGVQVPGGTIDPGESPEAAIVREMDEESGLVGLRVTRKLAPILFRSAPYEEWQLRYFAFLEAPAGCPDEWTQTVSQGERDKDLVFVYEWWPLERAMKELAGSKGVGLRAAKLEDEQAARRP